MTIIEKDILTVDRGIICHQTNCQGVMGTGMALAIKNKCPEVYRQYKLYLTGGSYNESRLGTYQLINVGSNLWVCNLFCQDRYGRDKRYTSYGAWEKVLPKLRDEINGEELLEDIYFPYNVGCMNAGGDFRIISAMIEEIFPHAIFCKLPANKT